MSMWEDIAAFHTKFKLPQEEVPGFPSDEILDFRLRFLKEEVEEFEDAVKKKNVVEAFDALIDLVYVAMGTAHMMNVPWDEGWEHVHTANMAKVRTGKKSESKRGSPYDVTKPEGWVSPNKLLVAELLLREHWLLTAKNRKEVVKKEENIDAFKLPKVEGKDGDL